MKIGNLINSRLRTESIQLWYEQLRLAVHKPRPVWQKAYLRRVLPFLLVVTLIITSSLTYVYQRHADREYLNVVALNSQGESQIYSAFIEQKQDAELPSVGIQGELASLSFDQFSSDPQSLEIYVDQPAEEDITLVTAVVHIADEKLEFNTAHIELQKTASQAPNTIVRCPSWDFDTQTGGCGNWQPVDVQFHSNRSKVSFSVDHFSAYAGAYLEILTVQSNLTVGDRWEVAFQTYGNADLSISTVEGSEYGVDVQFLDFFCGDTRLDSVYQNDQIVITDYSCDGEVSRLINRSVTPGIHVLEFLFADTTYHAKNFACDVGTLDDECQVTSSQVITNGSVISGTGSLIVKNGGNLSTAATEFFSIAMGGDVTIESGGAITGNLTNLSADNLTVQSDAAITSNGKGYASRLGSGSPGYTGTTSSKSGGGGAGHGGAGGSGENGISGSIYGSLTEPVTLGSGGGTYNSVSANGGNGGGALRLTISGSTNVDGTISANGNNGLGNYGAGGSGGSVYLTTGSLSGNGSISSHGGNGYAYTIKNAGGGGGGRIAIYYTSNSFAGSVLALGGSGPVGAGDGAAGTVYKKPVAQDYGDLLINNTGRDLSTPTYLLAGNYTFHSLSVTGNGRFELRDGVSIVLTNNIDLSDTFYVANTSSTGEISHPAPFDLTTTNTATIIGGHESWPIRDLHVASGTLALSGEYQLRDATISGVLTHTANSSEPSYLLSIQASGDVEIAAGGSINLNGRGYSSSNGPGSPGSTGTFSSRPGAGGAGHGGVGGAGMNGVAGTTYGESTQPVLLGSGGGAYSATPSNGGAGGGALRLDVAGETIINGAITANGTNAPGNNGGGASGGSIYITSSVISGSAAITANAGNGHNSSPSWSGGGGGGGRIAIFSQSATYSGLIGVTQGIGPNDSADGQPGTIHADFTAPVSGITQICSTSGNNCTPAGTAASPQEAYVLAQLAGTAEESETPLFSVEIALKNLSTNKWYNEVDNSFTLDTENRVSTTTSESLPFTGSLNWLYDTTSVPWIIDDQYEVTLYVANQEFEETKSTAFFYRNSPPVVSSVSAEQSMDSVLVSYDVTDVETSSTTVSLLYDVGVSLTSGITGDPGVIPVSDTTFFPNSGTVAINDEMISYTSKTSSSLEGTVTRGVLNTTATSHLENDVVWFVGQNTQGDTGSVLNGTNKYITGDAKTDLNGFYSTTARLRVFANDGASSTMVGSATTSTFTLDFKDPSWSNNFKVNASYEDPLITIPCVDEETIEMKLGLSSDLSDGEWQPYQSSRTISQLEMSVSNPFTIYVQCRDSSRNTSTLLSATTPQSPTSLYYQDISNVATSEWRQFIAWSVVSEPTAGFSRYLVYRKVNDEAFTVHRTLEDRTDNYISDVGLSNLATYSYKILVEDDQGNVSYFSSTLTDTPDGTGGTDISEPVISAVTSDDIVTTEATVSWSTNKLSSSKLYYTASETYPGSSAASYSQFQTHASMVSSHQIMISGLAPNTRYYYMVESTDSSGNTGVSTSESYYFETNDGPIISDVAVTQVFESEAEIVWTTSEGANSVVRYATNANLSNATIQARADITTQHTMRLTGLSPSTRYYFFVESTDVDDNQARNTNIIDGGQQYYSFTTPQDTVGPIISNVDSPLVSTSGFTIIWNTSELATSQLQWGTTSSLGEETTTSTVYSIQHAVTLTGIDANTTYYYRVVSVDKAGNISTSSPIGTVSTAQAYVKDVEVPVFSNVSTGNSKGSSVQVTWLSNENTDSFVKYGSSQNALDTTVGQVESVTNHSVTMKNLSPSTRYYFVLTGRDEDGNIGTSTVYTFTTTNELGDEVVTNSGNASDSLIATVVDIIQKASRSFTIKILTALSLNPHLDSLPEEDVVELLSTMSKSTLNPPDILGTEIEVEAQAESATVRWITSKPANSMVAYVKESEFDGSRSDPFTTEVGDSQASTTNHEVSLIGLEPDTSYRIQTRSKDAFGPVASSNDIIFSTTALTPTISDVVVTSRDETSVLLAWETSLPTRRSIAVVEQETGVRFELTDPSYLRSHSIVVDSLSPGFSYSTTITAIDEYAQVTQSAPVTFTTSLTDDPPIIGDVRVVNSLIPGKIERVQTILTWRTDKPSSSRVLVSQGGQIDMDSAQVLSDAALSREHILVTSSFLPGNVYRYKIYSTDIAGNTAETTEYTMITPQPSQSVVDVIVSNVEEMFGFLRF